MVGETRRLHKLAPSLRPTQGFCLTVATPSDITVCKAKSWLSHLIRGESGFDLTQECRSSDVNAPVTIEHLVAESTCAVESRLDLVPPVIIVGHGTEVACQEAVPNDG